MANNLIIGITGTLGAGKGTIVEYLIDKYNFKHYSAREFIAREIKKRGLTINRDTLREVADNMREQNGPAVVLEGLYDEAEAISGDCILESIRCPGEITALRKKGNFILFAIDANPKTRYDRITKRKTETDNVTFDKFVEQEALENNNIEPFKMNLKTCISEADYVFNNNGSFENLNKQIKNTMEKIKND